MMKPLPLFLIVTGTVHAVSVSDVAPVWSGHRVRFTLMTHGKHQFVAFYDADRSMTIAQRQLPEGAWIFKRLDSKLGWDSHNAVVISVDRNDCLHVSGNMHNVPLVYFRSEKPLDVASLQPVHRMIGDREKNVTYPVFLYGKDDALIFNHRDGKSGNGSTLYNLYDETTRSWKRLLDTPLFDGGGEMNAYPKAPLKGPDGFYHMTWLWRDTPMAETNHDLSYARSRDLVSWESADGKPLKVPLTLSTPGAIADPVPAKGGIINGSGDIGFDPSGMPVIAYHKYDTRGNTQFHLARFTGGIWKSHQLTDWNYRWNFSGGGTLTPEVSISAPQNSEGVFSVTLKYPGHSGRYAIDPKALTLGEKLPSENQIPDTFSKVVSSFPGMTINWAADSGKATDGKTYHLRWESLPSNRDKPRPEPWPEPSMLQVIAVP